MKGVKNIKDLEMKLQKDSLTNPTVSSALTLILQKITLIAKSQVS
jgi:hypothetical protein